MGRHGELPWRLPEDLKHFRALTIDKPVIMGRKTYDSIGKPLARRRNIVLTRDSSFEAPGVEVAKSIEDVWQMAAQSPEVAVIGGSEIFRAFGPYVDTAYVTEVDADVEGDVYYVPPKRAHSTTMLDMHPADERNAYPMRFLRYDYTNAEVTGGSAKESKPSG